MANAITIGSPESSISDLQPPVVSAVKRIGAPETARRLGLDISTVLRLAAGVTPRRGSLVIARGNLHKLHD